MLRKRAAQSRARERERKQRKVIIIIIWECLKCWTNNGGAQWHIWEKESARERKRTERRGRSDRTGNILERRMCAQPQIIHVYCKHECLLVCVCAISVDVCIRISILNSNMWMICYGFGWKKTRTHTAHNRTFHCVQWCWCWCWC